MFQQVYDPIAHSLGLSSIFAALPLLTMFVLLGGLKWAPYLSAFIALLVATAVAVLVYGMPVPVTLNVALYGAAFSALTVLWIIINAIWIHTMMIHSGYFVILRRNFAAISNDQRVQAILIAFSFGALIEALAGAGTPIAISGAMLISLGMQPLKGAAVALVANTAPVAFGALAVPITTLTQVTGQSYDLLGATVGRQTPVIALFVPLVLVWIVDGRRGLRQTWPAALTAGLAFAIAQFLCSNYISVALADVLASLVSAAVLVIFMRIWTPATIVLALRSNSVDASADSNPKAEPSPSSASRKRDAFLAYFPYLAIIVIFSLAQFGFIKDQLAHGVVRFDWPGLRILTSAGKLVGTTFNLNYLPCTGTLLFIAGLVTVAALRISAIGAARAYAAALVQLRWAIPTVLFVLAIAFVMNYSGQTITLGQWLAGAGHAFAFLSAAVGWIGVAVTGSDNSSNALFGALQIAAAKATNLPPVLLAAANTSGGVLGKMISPQSLAVGAAAVGLIGREGDIFRMVVGWSIVLLLGLCTFVYLQTTPVLSWMVP
jgi:lactate permease